MKELISEIVYLILTGQDYRPYVLATINKRFIDKIQELTSEIFEYKLKGGNWLEKLLYDISQKRGEENKFKLLWFAGLNAKTVRNMTGGICTKEVCLDLGKKNIEALNLLLREFEGSTNTCHIEIIIKKDNMQVQLDNLESLLFINTISTMKQSIQGGAWSEVGKKTEKWLLFVIFRLLEIPDDSYTLGMERGGLTGNREIDAIVFNKRREPITIELKLLGIGNPEIGDEAIAREVSLFIVDSLTDMMREEFSRKGIKVIEFRREDLLLEIYNFFKSRDVDCSPPGNMTPKELQNKITRIITEWREE